MPTLNLQIAAVLDDGRHRSDDTYSTALITFGNLVSGGFEPHFRFVNVTVPKDATITAASIKFTAVISDAELVILSNIYAHNSDNSGQIIDETSWHDIVDSNLTAAFVPWDNIPAWTLEESGPDTTSPDISSVIQEIVNRSGWASGNALHIIWLDDGTTFSAARRGYSFETDPAKAAELHIEYTEPAPSLPTEPGGSQGYHMIY